MNIEHVGLYARDSAALADWYTEVFELRELDRIERPDRQPVVFLQGETGAVLEILPTEAEAVVHELDQPGYTHLGIPVANLEAARARLKRHGIEMHGVRTTSNGWTIGYFADPEGNLLELIER